MLYWPNTGQCAYRNIAKNMGKAFFTEVKIKQSRSLDEVLD